MATRVRITIDELSSTRVEIKGGDEDYNLAPTETRIIELPEGKSLTISGADALEILPPDEARDVFSPTNRPNGITHAEIGPKLPKASGELQDVQEGGRFVQRSVELDPGKATQGGGVDSKHGETPGAKELAKSVGEEAAAGTGSGNAAATGAEGDVTRSPQEANKAEGGGGGAPAKSEAKSSAPAPAKK